MMDEPHATEMMARLRRVEGQVRGLQRMIAQGRECEDVLTQLMAARSSLEQVSLLLLDTHVQRCLLRDCALPEETLRALLQTLRMWVRFGAPAAQLPD